MVLEVRAFLYHSHLFLIYSLLQLFTSEIPFFYIQNNVAVAMKVIQGYFPEQPNDQEVEARGLGKEIWGLMKRCWDIDPVERPSIDEIRFCLQIALKKPGEG